MIKSKIRRKFFYRHYIRPLYQKYHGKKILSSRRETFQKYGRELLQQFGLVMEETKCPYWLEFGTLLGAVREHGFMPHDFDLDISIPQESYNSKVRETLLKYGFKKVRRMYSPRYNVIEDTYSYKGVTIDIVLTFYDEKRDLMYSYAFNEVFSPSLASDFKKMDDYCIHKCYFPKMKLTEISFLGLKTYIPDNYKEHLSMIYGPDFMIPNPNWTSDSSHDIQVIYDKNISLIKDFE